jgi:hypothetical protein
MRDERALIVVGPCGVGKSTLVAGLRRAGVAARAVAQEHSQVPDLFRRHSPAPALVVFLAATLPTVRGRRLDAALGAPQYRIERQRLRLAQGTADLVVHTDGISAEEVLVRVLTGAARIDPALGGGL